MSQFQFPRIHFFGQSIIDPATGNNNYHFPLVTYEPVTATAVLPPRIYLDDDPIIGKDHELNAVAPSLLKDQNGSTYIEIEPINTPDLFKSWSITPLGDHAADGAYHKLYEGILSKNEGSPLKGKCPGHWNYYGTMNFSFEKVYVNSIQVLVNGEVITYSQETQAPLEIAGLLGAELSFNDQTGRNSAVMIDVSPTFSIYTQVFCDRVLLKNGNEVILSGQPVKASIRQINPQRIINDASITGASGTFYTTISLSQLQDGRDSPIIKFFENNGVSPERLMGVFIRYDLFEVSELQAPDYQNHGPSSNPAKSTVLGCISPWYKGEMTTAPPGRLLIPNSGFLEKKELGSVVSYFDPQNKLLSFDFVGSFPEIKNEFDSTYEIYNLGTVEVCLATGSDKKESKIGSFVVGSPGIDRAGYITSGGLIDISLRGAPQAEQSLLEGGELKLYLSTDQETNSVHKRILLSKENTFRIITDQIGLYCDENDPPKDGYLSNGTRKEQCIIRVFKNGRPLKGKIQVTVFELALKPFACGERLSILDHLNQLSDGQKFVPNTSKAGHKFYAFYPNEAGILPTDIKHYMLITGAFVNMRILPFFDYKKYLAEEQEPESRALDFDLILQELLVHYDLIYPSSGIITPFEAGHFRKICEYAKKIMSLDNWHRYLFMPSSRDLPKSKRDLLFKWLENEMDKERYHN